jgi:hypothetical protein
MEFVKTRSTLSETMECVKDGYKVVVNVSLEKGEIKNLNGNISKAEVEEGKFVEGTYFNAYNRNGEWRTDVSEVANAEYAKVSALAIEAVDKIVASYEA